MAAVDNDANRPSSIIVGQNGAGGRKLAEAAGATCERKWFGTATACRGECPEGWTEIKRQSVCPDSSCNSIFLWIPCGECDGADFGMPCDAFSKKALCERCQ